jgi:hypothetical protein
LYNSCIDEAKIDADGIEPILSLLNTELGGWPILQGSSWDSSKFNLTNLLLKLRQYSYNIIYRVHTIIDEKNSSATAVVVIIKYRLLIAIKIRFCFRLVRVLLVYPNGNIMQAKLILLLLIEILCQT